MSPRSPPQTTNPSLPPHNDIPKQTPLNLIQNLIKQLENDPVLMKDVESLMIDAASSRGVLLRHPSVPDALRTAPVTLFPTVIEKECLDAIVNVQSSINGLMHKVACDREFIEGALKGAASVDPFIASLLGIYRQVDVEQQWQLGLFRSDYLQQQVPFKRNGPNGDTRTHSPFKQVEVNTICVGLAGIGALLPPCHASALEFLSPQSPHPPSSLGDSLQLYGDALNHAHSIYCSEHPSPGRKILLIVIHNGYEFNIMDQRMVEGASGLKGIRRSFKELRETAVVDDEGRLWVEGMEVAVVYFRTAYAPGHFDGQQDWDLRLMLEKSQAIKCPSVAYQLAGFKKIQQELSRKEVLSRYFPGEPTTVAALLALNVAQFDLSAPSITRLITDAISNPDRYVLKPNREGGGNNLYFQDLVDKIKAVVHTPLAQDFILMEKIHPITQTNILIRPGKETVVLETVSEVGVFGVVVGRGKEVVRNGTGGRVLVRSKERGVNEGGLALGLACLGSAWVV